MLMITDVGGQSVTRVVEFHKEAVIFIFGTSNHSKISFFGGCKTNLNPILPMLWKDVVTRGGGHYGPPLFFRLWGCQKHKTEPWHIFGTKNYLKSHIEHFQVPQFSRQRAENFNRYYSRKIQNFQNFEFQGCYAPETKAENMYNSN